jgi:hypothetical protein
MKESMVKESYSVDAGSNNATIAVMFALGIGLLILGDHIGGMVGTSIDFLSDLICLMTIIIVIFRTFRKTVYFKSKMIGWALFSWWIIIETAVIFITNK